MLITAAAGGVGSAAVQIAAALGARPLGVASPDNHDYLRSLGASAVFEHHAADWVQHRIGSVLAVLARSGLFYEEGPRAVILLLRLGAFRGHGLNTDPWRAGLGLALFCLGLGFATWARVHIGRNWGTPMTQKDEPELVTSGPYHLVRHPIYSGILVAGVGTAVALSWLWLIAVALAGVYFVYSAKVEEHYLTEQFPDAYPVYKSSTKMLVPLIL